MSRAIPAAEHVAAARDILNCHADQRVARVAEMIAIFASKNTRLLAAVQRVRDDACWCPVCDGHHSAPTAECP